jgi:hypothetical protein
MDGFPATLQQSVWGVEKMLLDCVPVRVPVTLVGTSPVRLKLRTAYSLPGRRSIAPPATSLSAQLCFN